MDQIVFVQIESAGGVGGFQEIVAELGIKVSAVLIAASKSPVMKLVTTLFWSDETQFFLVPNLYGLLPIAGIEMVERDIVERRRFQKPKLGILQPPFCDCQVRVGLAENFNRSIDRWHHALQVQRILYRPIHLQKGICLALVGDNLLLWRVGEHAENPERIFKNYFRNRVHLLCFSS